MPSISYALATKNFSKTGNNLTPPDSLKTMDIKIKNNQVDFGSKTYL